MEDTRILAEKYERFSNGSSNSDRLDKMADAILTLRGLGLEPIGFTMDADTLYQMSSVAPTEKILEHYAEGWFCLEELLEQYDFSIMGIPIEPNFNGRVIKARRKKENE